MSAAPVKLADKKDAKKAGKFDFQKSYARRRPDEPKSHYNARVQFIKALLKAEGSTLTDDRVEVLSHCFSNVRYMKNKYGPEIMTMIEKYDPLHKAEMEKLKKDEEEFAKKEAEMKARFADKESKESKEGAKEANGEANGSSPGDDKSAANGDEPDAKRQKTEDGSGERAGTAGGKEAGAAVVTMRELRGRSPQRAPGSPKNSPGSKPGSPRSRPASPSAKPANP